jgi:uncharacterized protein (UPF0276 family)
LIAGPNRSILGGWDLRSNSFVSVFTRSVVLTVESKDWSAGGDGSTGLVKAHAPSGSAEEVKLKGVGVGLRPAFSNALLKDEGDVVQWVEVHPENYIRRGGEAAHRLDRAREKFPISTHGLTLCFGNHAEPEQEYLQELKTFLKRVDAPWYSDHLCFCSFGNAHSHDLLPLPRTEETVKHCVGRIRKLREELDIPIAIENVSTYLDSEAWDYEEHEFVTAILEEADALLLLDVNNVYVNAKNHGFDPYAYIDALPAGRVCQIHMAGHLLRSDGLRIDTHGEPIADDVYRLLEYTLKRIGPTPVLLERDTNFPPYEDIMKEASALRGILEEVAP